MDDRMSKLIITLTVIGIISALLLAFVYQWTLPHIKKHQAVAREKAVFAVLPGAEDYKGVKKDGLTFYEGYDEAGSRVGVALIITGGGFQGTIKLMVGTDPEAEKIYGIRILEHEETPGLGARITGKEYKSNFKNKAFGDYKVVKREVKNEKEVEAISGATISSRKVTNIVENAITKIKRVYGGEA